MKEIAVLDADKEVIFATSPEKQLQVQQAAAEVDANQLLDFAIEAGFVAWMNEEFDNLIHVGGKVDTALQMPETSPYIQALRTEAGYPEGLVVEEEDVDYWSLNVGESPQTEAHDTGLRLVSHRKIADTEERIQVPLDIVIPTQFFSLDHGQEDKLRLWVGKEQLPTRSFLYSEQAQQFLIVASKFIELIQLEEVYRIS